MDGAVRPTLIKLVLRIFTYVYVRIDQPLPSLSQTVTLGGPLALSLKRDVINEWPYTGINVKNFTV